MKKDKLSFNFINDFALWDDFVDSSPQGNIFCKSVFLNSLDVDYKLCLVSEGNKPTAGTVILIDSEGNAIKGPYSLSLYNGILFSGKESEKQLHRKINKELTAVDYLITQLQDHYRNISLWLHPNFSDLRSISWFNYHTPEKGQFHIELQYTGIINLHECDNFEDYLSSIRQSRRYEYRKALKEGYSTEVSNDIDILEHLYLLTFKRQNIEIDSASIKRVLDVSHSAVQHGFGKLMICRSPSNDPIAATVFLNDHHSGYYMVGANHPEYRNSGGGTLLFLENVRGFLENKINFVDVVGINSPNRGDFKTSFNAKPVPYFLANLEKK